MIAKSTKKISLQLHKKESYFLVVVNMALITVLARGIKYLFNILLARQLGDRIDLYGDFSLGIYTLQIIAFILLSGTSISAVILMGKFLNMKETDKAIAYVRWNFRIVSALSFGFLLFFGLFIIVITLLHLLGVYTFDKHGLLVHMICFAPFFAMSTLFSSYLLSDKHPYWFNFFMNGAIYFLGSVMLFANQHFFKISIATMENLWIFSLILLGIIMAWSLCVAFIKMPQVLFPSLNFFLLNWSFDKLTNLVKGVEYSHL